MKKEPAEYENKFGENHVWPDSLRFQYGHLLEEGDILCEEDVYDSSSGRWGPCPVPGLPIGKGNTAIWVRPVWAVKKD